MADTARRPDALLLVAGSIGVPANVQPIFRKQSTNLQATTLKLYT